MIATAMLFLSALMVMIFSQVEPGPTFDFWSLLAQIGLGAVVAAPFVFVWRKAEARAEAAQKRSDDLVTTMLTEFTPALIRAQTAIQESSGALSRAQVAIVEQASHQLTSGQVEQVIRLLNRLDT